MIQRFALAGVLLAASSALGCDAVVERLGDAAALRQIGSTHREWLDDDAMHVFLCGTGAPLPDPSSAGACTVVVAGGKVWVVDVGPGSQEVAQLGGVPTRDLGGILLTHFHSDHIGELGEWAMQSWVAGRQGPLHVYGPPGVKAVVDGFRQAYRQDDEYRIAHHGLENLPRSATTWVPHVVPYEAGDATVVLDESGLVIKAFAVDHQPVEPAVGYRFEYADRVVVISGDTKRSPNLERNAAGADLLIHEVLLKAMIAAVSDSLGQAGDGRRQRMARDVLDYHASPAEAVASARAAGVDRIVFTHLVPPLPGPLRKWLFMRGIDPGDDLEVILGEDGMHFRLPRGSDAIESHS